MKITIITKECKPKDKDAPAKANLCFRLRDKDVDLKVRSDIEVMLDYWDNDALSYRRTKNLQKPIFVFDSEIRMLTSKSVPTLRLCLTIGTMMHFPIEGQRTCKSQSLFSTPR